MTKPATQTECPSVDAFRFGAAPADATQLAASVDGKRRTFEGVAYSAKLLLKAYAIAFALAVSAVASANEYETVVRAQLEAIKDVAGGEGFRRAFDDHYDLLENQARDEYTFELRSGREYFIASVCDQDCSDIDLKLFDENDNVIAEDDSEDDAPIVKVTPRWSGKFRLGVTMYDCASEPCYYGITVMGR